MEDKVKPTDIDIEKMTRHTKEQIDGLYAKLRKELRFQ